MKILNMISAITYLCTYTSVTYAQNCTQPLSCEELGYIDSPNKCSDNAMLLCPTDNNKVFCRSKPICNAQPGYILYSDFSCSENIILSKKPIGVILSKNRAMSLYDAPNKMSYGGGESYCENYSIENIKNWEIGICGYEQKDIVNATLSKLGGDIIEKQSYWTGGKLGDYYYYLYMGDGFSTTTVYWAELDTRCILNF